GGNWGGSYLTVPTQGKHTAAAKELALWLTAPEQQIAAFVTTGNYPSQVGAYGNPALTGAMNPYFNNAPIGQIFADRANAVKVSPYLFISPFFILFGLVGLFPLLYTGWVSLHAWDLIGGQGSWTGFDNFAFVLHQRQFWVALRNTLSIFLISAAPQLIAATAIAAALDSNLRNKTFWRMSVLLPFVVMPVAVTLIF